ncbi:IclR family transcriptional regulator [Pseudopelagicola sp. nBUS_20]|uniref:IclR family transcriptional regulator n=1 Tax=Pseudopelagicola sp. nBUS_20 TaxID=3395317 RepID=UPI003EB8DE3F
MPEKSNSSPYVEEIPSANEFGRVIKFQADDDRRERLGELGVTGKAFLVLELVMGSAHPSSISEIIRITGLTKPTAHRVVNMLVEMGFLERDPSGRGFIEGASLLRLAHHTLLASAPRSLRHSILKEVTIETGETCNYGVLSGSEIMYLDRVEAKWPLGLRFAPGSRVPAHCTALGKLLMSLYSDDDLRTLTRSIPLTEYTQETIVSSEELFKAVKKVRLDGIGTDNQEFMHGVVCVSVPVIDRKGNCYGGIAVSAPETRMTLNEMLGFVPKMKEAAQRFADTFDTDQSKDDK